MPSAAKVICQAQDAAIDASERLIVALDFPTVGQASAIVEKLGEAVSFYKIGLHLQLARGLFRFATKLIEKKHLFLDFKYIDIDDTICGVISNAADIGIDFVTVYQSPQVIAAAKRGRGSSANPKILTVTLLTDRDQAYIEKEYRWNGTVSEFVVEKALMVANAGGDGVICSPQEVCAVREAIREAFPDREFLIVTPGIRPAWSLAKGHKRAGTPTEAILCGADYLVVGRPIIRDEDPVRSAKSIISEMQDAFDQRALASTNVESPLHQILRVTGA